MLDPRRLRIRFLYRKRADMQLEINQINDEIDALGLELDREGFTCRCVRLNEDIGIHDMVDQEKAGRVGLGLGWVSQTLSALRDCEVCKGAGKP